MVRVDCWCLGRKLLKGCTSPPKAVSGGARSSCPLGTMSSCKKGTLLDRGSPYPEEIVERVVSLLPFPAILKARGLTRWWSSALSGCPASSRQYHAKAASTNSDKYCPVYISPHYKCFIGMNVITREWRKMYNVSYFKSQKKLWSFACCTACGALICGVDESLTSAEIFMKNVITGSSKTLSMPIRPKRLDHRYVQVVGSGSGTFRIIVYLHPWTIYHGETHLQIYDSKRDSWFMVDTEMPIPYFTHLKTPFSSFAGSVYFESKLYVLYQDKWASLHRRFTAQLMAYNLVMEENSTPRCTSVSMNFPLLYFPEDSIRGRPREVGMVVCGNELLVVVLSEATGGRIIPANSIGVFKLDLGSEDWKLVARGPPWPSECIECTTFVAHEGVIYMGGRNNIDGPVSYLVFDVQKQKWGFLSSPYFGGSFGQFFAFEPGLDPFVMI